MPEPGAFRGPFSFAELEANHQLLEQRAAHHRRFGFDVEASIRYVLGHALPLCGQALDVGTGKGRFLIQLAWLVKRVTTVDLDANEQRLARMEAAYAGVADRIHFVVRDARSLPWPAASFDTVASWNAFYHMECPELVLAQMIRLVKPGGKLVLADFSLSGFHLMHEIHVAEGRRHPHPPNQFGRWQAMLRQAGLLTQYHCGAHQEVLIGVRPLAFYGTSSFVKNQTAPQAQAAAGVRLFRRGRRG